MSIQSPEKHPTTSRRRRFDLLTDVLTSAAGAPDRPAFVDGSGRIDHGGFERRWRLLAANLQSRGLEPGDRVVIALPKSIDAVVSMAATLAAGGVYVPVDDTQPWVRSEYILRDSQATFLITSQAVLDRAPGPVAIPGLREILRVEDLEPVEAGLAPVDCAPDDLAFLLYTSGSTGKPKGVQTTHRNLLNFIHWALDELQPTTDDVFSCHAALTFDLTTFDLYTALAARASVVLIPGQEARSPSALGRRIEEEGITIWYSVPSILQLLLASGALAEHDVSSLRHILFAGEVFPIRPLRQLIEALPAATYHNLYGPTETNVCTAYEVKSIDPERSVPVPIGRPLPGVEVRVLDEDGREVGPGEVGELVVEGPCVTPGYWRLDGHRNVENHARGAHATGDLVRFEGDQLIYHGRVDNMIKLHGYRIELGEIESILGLDPRIGVAAVLPVESGGQTRLVACIAPAAGQTPPSLIALKTHCAAHLPRYMIPHASRVFERLPVNANGKIDRPALARLLSAEE